MFEKIQLMESPKKAGWLGGYILCGFLVLMLLGLGMATDAFSDCRGLYVEGKLADAAQCYDEVIRENSSPAEVAFALNQKSLYLYTEIGDLDGAIKATEEASRIDPQYGQFLSTFIPTEKTRSFARANLPIYEANKTDPTNITALLNDSADLYKRGMYDESLKRVDEALALDPKNTQARLSKVIVLIAKGERKNVTKVFDEMVEYGFKDAYVWDDLAAYLAGDSTQYYEESIKCLDRTIAIYDESIRQDSRNVSAWNNKGVELSTQASVDRTAYLYLTLNTDDASISKSSAHARYREDKWKKALDCFDEATQLDPKCGVAWYNKGLILYELNDDYENLDNYEAIVKCFDQAKSLPDREDICSRLVDTRYAEFAARNKLQELRMASRDVDRVAAYA
jgi:tetratricopeptide (TPR) repeat protein